MLIKSHEDYLQIYHNKSPNKVFEIYNEKAPIDELKPISHIELTRP